MLAIYGPNPSGAQSSRFRSFPLDDTDASQLDATQ
jgi:hypothetical protein